MKETSKNLMEILENDFKYKNTAQGVLVTITTADGKEDVSIESGKFCNSVANRYRKKYDEIASIAKIKSCIKSYQTEIEEQKRVKNSNRCDRGENMSILIDAGNCDDTYYEITSDGFSVKENGSQFFFKHLRKGEIPLPDMENGDVDRIFKYCRVPENMKELLIAYIGCLFIGNIEHPCLVLTGEHGVGKSTMCTFIKALADPVGKNYPAMFPSKDSDITLMFQQNYLLAFDNLQSLSAKQSDRLCTCITHGEEARRQLYTTTDMVYFDLCQPIILNGINNFIKQADLLSRSIVMKLEKNMADDKVILEQEFMEDRSIILGGFVKILIEALKRYKPNSVSKLGKDIRMSSFYDYGYYICEAWKKGSGAVFCAAYIDILENQLKNYVKDNTLGEVMKMFLELEDDYEWGGTMKELSVELNEFVEDFPDISIPSVPNRLSRELRKLKYDLEENGIYMEFSKTISNCSYIRLYLDKE